MSPVIEINNLHKVFRSKKAGAGLSGAIKSLFAPEYSEFVAVDNLSFSINKGERVAFIGPNGAGKSTTIKVLSGILHPTAGTVSILGMTPWRDRTQMAYHIGTVFGQRSQLWYHLPALDTFNLLGKAYLVDKAIHKQRIANYIEMFDIGSFIDKPVRQLSLGQRMRCEIVASLLHKPDILFLDEPTVGLDIAAKATIRDLILHACNTEGMTVLLTSHDTGDMEQVCNRVVLIDKGKLVTDSSVQQLRANYIKRKVITLATAEPEINLRGAGIVLREQQPHKLVIEIDTNITSVETIIQNALSQSSLRDLTVEDPPMEEIITSIYQRRDVA